MTGPTISLKLTKNIKGSQKRAFGFYDHYMFVIP